MIYPYKKLSSIHLYFEGQIKYLKNNEIYFRIY